VKFQPVVAGVVERFSIRSNEDEPLRVEAPVEYLAPIYAMGLALVIVKRSG
jgi:hypothetical protein